MTGVHALVPAAGAGRRFDGAGDKLWTPLGGRPLLAWTLAALLDGGVESVTVALPAERWERPDLRASDDSRVRWVAGGATRQLSMAACLEASSATAEDLVVVHDGARPLVAAEDLQRTVVAASEADGAILGRPVSDTLKLTAGGLVQGTVDRSFLFRAETPQIFSRRLLERALALAARDGFDGTDEASLVERLPGAKVVAVEAHHPNPKLTTAADLPWIVAMLQARGLG